MVSCIWREKTAMGAVGNGQSALKGPWQVNEIEFIENSETNRQELHICIVFTKGAKFTCTEVNCGERELPVHDTKEKTWRHMNFFQYKCYIHARVPRIICPNHKVRKVEVPWGRKESGFTLLMDTYLVEMVKVLSVRAVAQMLEEQDTKLWRLLKYYVEQARLRCDFSLVEEHVVHLNPSADTLCYNSPINI